MTALVSFLFSSGGVVCLLVAAAGWIWLRPGSVHGRRLLMAVALFYAAMGSHAVAHGTGRLLVIGLRPFQNGDVPGGRTAIVVLGAQSFTARDWDRNRLSVPERAAASRVLEAVRVFKLTNAEWVVSSGGPPASDDGHEPSGLTMADALLRLGVPNDRLLIQAKSRNTHEEAVIVRSMLAGLPIDHVVLVTSDLHMRRSLGAFRAEGFNPIPALARHQDDSVSLVWRVIPSEGGLAESAAVWHELLGLGYYFVRGWYRP